LKQAKSGSDNDFFRGHHIPRHTQLCVGDSLGEQPIPLLNAKHQEIRYTFSVEGENRLNTYSNKFRSRSTNITQSSRGSKLANIKTAGAVAGVKTQATIL